MWFPINRWFDVWDLQFLAWLLRCTEFRSVDVNIQSCGPVRVIVNKAV